MDECPTSPTDPDDCGEGLHLLGVSSSQVTGNTVSNNVGGILVSDGGLVPVPPLPGTPVGPAADNLIANNTSTNNAFDCGITLPGHDPLAVTIPGGLPQPDVGGVYGNQVLNNVSNNNGAAGLLDATPYPGTGSYDNVFSGNSASGNGNAGFTLHSHAPFQDVSGISVSGNKFGTNNLAGDPDTGVTATTGIMLFSAVVPTTIVVTGNSVLSNVNGIAYNNKITLIASNNHPFANVTNQLFPF
jgi:hypothetical protein